MEDALTMLRDSWVESCRALHTSSIKLINLTNIEMIVNLSCGGVVYNQAVLPPASSYASAILATADLECSLAIYSIDIAPVTTIMGSVGVSSVATVFASGGSTVLVTYKEQMKEFELVNLGKTTVAFNDQQILLLESGKTMQMIDASSFFNEENIERLRVATTPSKVGQYGSGVGAGNEKTVTSPKFGRFGSPAKGRYDD